MANLQIYQVWSFFVDHNTKYKEFHIENLHACRLHYYVQKKIQFFLNDCLPSPHPTPTPARAPASPPSGDVGGGGDPKDHSPPGPYPAPPPLVAPGGRHRLSRATPVKGAAGSMPLGSPTVVLEVGHRADDRRRPCSGNGVVVVLACQRRRAMVQDTQVLWRQRCGPDLGLMGLIWVLWAKAMASLAVPSAAWRCGCLAPAIGDTRACGPAPLICLWVSGGQSFLAPVPQCTCPDLVGPSRSLLGVLGYSCGGFQACSSSSTSCLLRWRSRCMLLPVSVFVGVRSPAPVKTMLSVADADHGDTCGCHSLLGGLFLGRATPSPLCARENPGSIFLDRRVATLRRRPLLEGAVLAAGVSWLSKMVAVSNYAQDARLRGRNVRHRSHSLVGSSKFG
jgi:hypothetical protein